MAQQTNEYLKADLSEAIARNILTIETLVLAVFDMYCQSEVNLRDALAVLIGDKYIQCLNELDSIVIGSGEHNRLYHSSTMTPLNMNLPTFVTGSKFTRSTYV